MTLAESASDESSIDEDHSEASDQLLSNKAGHFNRSRAMILSSRGIDARHRHLLEDFAQLLAHIKKESKHDQKKELFSINEVAELNGCDRTIFFEVRKSQGVYLWFAKCPSGPSVRFFLENVHTLDELHLPGNGMKGTRTLVSFDSEFEDQNLGVIKDILSCVFGSPGQTQKIRPYIDRIIHFAIKDGRIWFRHYQILEGSRKRNASEEEPNVQVDGLSLEEIGPRFALLPVKVLEGSFRGRVLWKNDDFISPAKVRSTYKLEKAAKRKQRTLDHQHSILRKESTAVSDDELDHLFD